MAPSELFAKMAAALDSNRKIRRGGRNARDVYLWVLRQVALRNADGSIPLEDVTDSEHVAEQLMCSVDEARDGYERAIAVRLITVDGDRCAIVGWDDDWGRRAVPGRERTAKWRARNENASGDATLHGIPPVPVTTPTSRVTDGDASVTRDAGEERRGEERREGRVTEDATAPLALAPPAGKRPRKPREKQARTSQPPDFAPSPTHREKATRLGLDIADEFARFTNSNAKRGSLWASWDHALHDWLDKAPEFNRGRAGPLGVRAATSPPDFRRLTDEDLR